MKYLKLVNVPLSELCNHGTLANGEKRIPWSDCGFNVSVLKSKVVQYEDSNGDYIQYLPIDKLVKVNQLITKMADILAQDGFSAEVVSEVAGTEDQSTWVNRRESSKRKQRVRHERKMLSIKNEAQLPE